MDPDKRTIRSDKPEPDAACPCGSRKKFRNCCKRKQDRNRTFMFIASVMGAVVVAKVFFSPDPGVRQAPPGKVWSEEHGHYHDATPGGAPAGTGVDLPTSTPSGAAQQSGPSAGDAPPGKVWSAEHQHWHDAPIGGESPITVESQPPGPAAGAPVNAGQIPPASGAKLTPQPAGPPPPGKVWSAEHGHWHDPQKP